jgi:hypothetical protein
MPRIVREPRYFSMPAIDDERFPNIMSAPLVDAVATDGGKDVFVHATTLERGRLSTHH